MRQRPFAIPGVSVSELTLGTWGLSGDGYGPVSEQEQDRVILRARALGITGFETADIYAAGAMETRLGALLGTDPDALIITKVGTDIGAEPPRKRFDPSWLRECVQRSGARLKRNVLDLVLLHNPSVQTLRKGEATGLMRELHAGGQLRSWGVSAGSAEVAEAALDDRVPALQLAFNCLWASDYRRLEERLRETKTCVLARSILAHGLLCGFWPGEKVFSEVDHRSRRWTPDELKRRLHQLDALRPLVRNEVSSLRSVALRWVLNHVQIATAVIGPRTVSQLDQLVRDVGSGPPYLPEDSLSGLEMRMQDFGAR
jgi:aryl-alcohol dehydrogenase-like predicted oxidoreductase